MLTYEYSARRKDTGEMVKAEVQAENQMAAAKLLIKQDLFPITVEEKAAKSSFSKLSIFNRVPAKERIIFTRQLSTLINAGLPLVQSLHTVMDQITSKQLHDIIGKVIASVEGGSSLSASFAAFPKVFNSIYISLVAAGETSGSLDKTLERLANQQEKDAAIASKIRGAMIYPAIVLVVIVGVVAFMLTTLLPQVAQLYKDLKKTLPLVTRILVAMSNFVIHFWWLTIIIVIGIGFGVRQLLKSTQGHKAYDQFKMDLPLFGPLFKKVYMARFARTQSTLLASGIPMLEAMSIVKNAVSNDVVAEAIERAMVKVKAGKSLSSSLADEPSFLPLVHQMTKIGEESGGIDEMLGRVATFYENEVDDAVKNISTTMEPVLMVVLGVIVGGVIMAVLLPVYGLVGSGLG